MDADIRAPQDAQSLCFFDDHISQVNRIAQAHERRFTTLIFDDNLPIQRIQSDWTPAVPTIDMALSERIKDGEVIEWRSSLRQYRYMHEEQKCKKVMDLVHRIVKLPRLDDETGYRAKNLTLLGL